MSFVEQDDVIAVNEGFLQRVFKEVLDVDIALPLPRMTWQDAMDKYGSDKPDTRFGFEICDISDIAANCSFKVFKDTVDNGGSVRLINCNGYADKFPRKEIDKLGEFVKTYRAKGLAWLKLAQDGSMTSSFAKFLSEEEIEQIKARANAKENDLLFVVADADWETAATALGALRCELAKRLDLAKKDDFKLLWVTDFPQFEYSEEEDRLVAKHHPFTAQWTRILHCLTPTLKRFVQRLMILSLTVVSLVAVLSVSMTQKFKLRCLELLVLQRRKHRNSLVI